MEIMIFVPGYTSSDLTMASRPVLYFHSMLFDSGFAIITPQIHKAPHHYLAMWIPGIIPN